MWFDRQRVILTEFDKPSTPDDPTRLLTFRSVLTLAAAADLSRRSAGDVSTAVAQARVWTTEAAREMLDSEVFDRNPAGLFEGDEILTLLVHYGEDCAQVFPARRRMTTDDRGGVHTYLEGIDYHRLFPSRAPVRARPTMIELNALHNYAFTVCTGYLRAGDDA